MHEIAAAGQDWPSPSNILPGDWLEIAFDGKALIGLIYAVQGDVYLRHILE